MEHKTFRGRVTLKEDGQPGEVEAVFATLNVIDLDGDVTVPGAFTDGEAVRIAAWSHNWGALPVGRGVIREEKDEAIMDGAFFFNTEAGREHYETVKSLGDLQEWSYAFDLLESAEGTLEGEPGGFLKKLKVHEVSPVMLGAGIGTHTNDIKAGKSDDLDKLVQAIHDLSIKLGAKSASDGDDEGEGDGEGDGQDEGDGDDAKSRTRKPSTAAERAAIDLMEYTDWMEETS